jgi:hypothetical protein
MMYKNISVIKFYRQVKIALSFLFQTRKAQIKGKNVFSFIFWLKHDKTQLETSQNVKRKCFLFETKMI